MVIYLLGCAIQHLNNWSQCCLATIHVAVSKKQTTTTIQTTQTTQKQGFKSKCMFQLLAIQPFVAAINYIIGEGNIVIVSRFVVTSLSRSKCIECIVHTMCW